MPRPFTHKAVEAFRPDPEKRLEIPDPGLTGLYLVVQPGGAKSWAVRYRHANKPRKLTLGRWPMMTVAAARTAAMAAIAQIEHGADPAAEKMAARRAQASEPDRDTIRALVDQFARRHLSKLRSGDEVSRVLDRYVVGPWADRKAQDITRRDVIEILDTIVDEGKPTTANRVRAHLSKLFGWMVERGVIEASPVQGVRAPAKENTRDRVLTDVEIRWFWKACDDLGQPWGPVGQLLLLTGQRLGEVVGMREAEIEGQLWTLPGERVKNGRTHTVPLSTAARAVLERMQRIAGRPGYLHTTTGTTPVSGFANARGRIAAKMIEIASEECGESVEIPHWTFHDLRRTAATGMARLGQPVHVVEAVLNHVSGSISGVAGIYNRHGYDTEKRAALEAWGRFVLSAVEGAPANVVEIGVSRR